jgi:transposase
VIPSAERERLHAAATGVDDAAAELKAAVQAAWRAGGSVRAIAAELGKSTRTIQNWLEGVRQEAPSLES